MASSTNSSMTSTSHTMTAFPPIIDAVATSKPGLRTSLLDNLTPENRHLFIAPPSCIPEASVAFSKEILDAFAAKLGEEQAGRLKEQRKKRKRATEEVSGQVLKIRKIYTEGFEVEQVWEQARRVIDALRSDAEQALEELDGIENEEDSGGVKLLKFDKDGFELGSDDELEEAEGGGEVSNGQESSFEPHDEAVGVDVNDENLDMAYYGEFEDEILDGDREDEEEEEEEEEDDDSDQPVGTYNEDPNGLNDGFFSIDEFNKQTKFLEQQDAIADPFSEEASDEGIDWEADPLAKATKHAPNSRPSAEMGDDQIEISEADEEDGPTFGNMDLYAPEGESDEEEQGEKGTESDEDSNSMVNNTNDILYKDFFEPPRTQVGKGERQASYLARQALKPTVAESENQQESLERAIADVRRDLFDESDHDRSEDALSAADLADPKSRKSAHERKQAKLVEEIRRLEAASVAKRQWALSGEVRAVDRPLNSLLEEDLEFELTGKPVLETTAEVNESMEELIKRRILAQEFDEVIRRRPDDLGISATRRGIIEIDDNKPQQSLAELYEEEHIKSQNPDTYISKADEKLQQEENAIEALWRNTSVKLDALSSWSYKPKPPVPSLTVVSDVATIAMEDAQPTMASGINGSESMLAPHEIYQAGKAKHGLEKGEIVLKSGIPIARQEMSREEKSRRRRREKERIRKRGGVEINRRPESRKTKEHKDTLGQLKRGGVKVIGQKGDLRDVIGNKVHAPAALDGAGSFKL